MKTIELLSGPLITQNHPKLNHASLSARDWQGIIACVKVALAEIDDP